MTIQGSVTTPVLPALVAAWQWSRHDRRTVVALVAVTGVIAAGNLALALLLAEALGVFQGPAGFAEAAPPLGGLLAAGAIRGLAGHWRGRLLRRMRYRVISAFDEQLVAGFLAGPSTDIDAPTPGSAARALAAGDRAGELLFGDLATALAELSLTPLVLALLWYFHPAMAIVGASLVALNALLILRFVRADMTQADRRAAAQSRLAGTLEQDLRDIEAIRIRREEATVRTRWGKLIRDEYDVLRRAARLGEATAAGQTALAMFIGGVALAVGGFLLLDGSGSFAFGDFIACQTLLFALVDPVRRVVASHAETLRVTADLHLRRRLIAAQEGGQTLPVGRAAPRPANVAAEDSGRAGDVQLLTSVPAVTEGTVLIANPAALLPGTLAQNLTLFNLVEDEGEIIRAVAVAQLDDVVAANPDGIQRQIDAGVDVFSRGQLYRIAVARAVLAKPRSVVLDGAVSSLDALTLVQLVRSLVDAGIRVAVVGNFPALRPLASAMEV